MAMNAHLILAILHHNLHVNLTSHILLLLKMSDCYWLLTVIAHKCVRIQNEKHWIVNIAFIAKSLSMCVLYSYVLYATRSNLVISCDY